MGRGDLDHRAATPGRRLRRWGSGLVAVVLVLAVLSYGLDLGPRLLGWEEPSPVTEPAEVAPPPGLTLPEPVPASAVADASSDRAADPAAVRRVVMRMLRDKDLGKRVAVAVSQLSGDPVFQTGVPSVTPASTMKVLTTSAALAVLGADHTFGTTVVAGETVRDVVLVGGGDPLLARKPDGEAYPARADILTLAKATARSLRRAGRSQVRLGYDASLFSGPGVNPAWPPAYVPDDVVSPISSLWVDEGRDGRGMLTRSDDPARDAATDFARALRRQGITVRGKPLPGVAPPDAPVYASVRSAPLAQIAQRTLEVSDNEAAEVLFRHVALAEGRPASFGGGAAAVRNVLSGLGVDLTGARILDGSGLSRRNSLRPQTLLDVVELAADEEHPQLRTVVAGLPVAGFTGSLTYRFDTGDPAGRGRVRAKTGTLSGVHGLAGVVTTRDGAVLSFVAIADRVKVADTLDARERIDQLAAALAGCRCAA